MVWGKVPGSVVVVVVVLLDEVVVGGAVVDVVLEVPAARGIADGSVWSTTTATTVATRTSATAAATVRRRRIVREVMLCRAPVLARGARGFS
jgi:L-amino acid N-acyltransferase YncA